MTDHSDLIERLRWRERVLEDGSRTEATIDRTRESLREASDALSSQSLSLSEARAERDEARKSWQEAADALTMESNRIDALLPQLAAAEREIERLKDFGGDAVDLAGRILENLGIGQDASREPGADRRRDRIAAMIQHSLDAANGRASVLENSPAGLADAPSKSPDPSLSSLRKGSEDRIRELEEALRLTAGALQAGRRSMAPVVAFTGEWAHLGKHRVSDILDQADTALGEPHDR